MSLAEAKAKLNEIEQIEPATGWENCDVIEGLREALEKAKRLSREVLVIICEDADNS